jgi:PAS domain S-box-containing protein
MSSEHKKPEIPAVMSMQWQAIVNILAKICDVPAALIMKAHPSEIEVFVTADAEGNPYERGDKEPLNTGLYCETVVSRKDMLLVPNALQDPMWDNNPDLELGMISYLGYPLIWPDGEVFGTMCVLDKEENPYSADIRELMSWFREVVEMSLAVIWLREMRRLAEEASQKAYNDLEKAVEERAVEILQTNIRLKTEIAERKKAEDELKESEQRFRAVFHSDHAVMFLVNPETNKIEDASRGACTYYGWTLDDLRKKKITEINTLPPEEVFEKMQAAKSGQGRIFDFQHRLANGEIRDVEVCTGPIQVSGKSLLFSVINDVTDRKRAEADLRESEERYRSLFERSKDGIYVTNEDGRIVDANQSFLDVFGYTLQEILGLNVRELYADPIDSETCRNAVKEAGSVEDYPVKLKRSDGTVLDCLIAVALRPGRDGKIIGSQGIVRDVTESKRLQRQLLQAQKMEAIGTLAGGIAHDFNN